MSEDNTTAEITMDTLSNLIAENPDIKAASLYARFMKGLKDSNSLIHAKAFPFRRTEQDSKFTLPKASVREGREATKEVNNFMVLDTALFNEWLEGQRETLRNAVRLRGGNGQVVMPSLSEVLEGNFSAEQLEQLAQHVAENRYKPRVKKQKEAKTPAKKKKKVVIENEE